jgi:hypothetical protein
MKLARRLSRRDQNERSQAVYCLEWCTKENRPVGNGMSGYAWRYHIQSPSKPIQYRSGSSPQHRTPRDGSLFGIMPGNKLPGDVHSVLRDKKLRYDFPASDARFASELVMLGKFAGG